MSFFLLAWMHACKSKSRISLLTGRPTILLGFINYSSLSPRPKTPPRRSGNETTTTLEIASILCSYETQRTKPCFWVTKRWGIVTNFLWISVSVGTVDCGDPGTPNNGLRVLSSTTSGSTVEYSCVEGYMLQGNSLRTCQANAVWSGEVPSCIGKWVATIHQYTKSVY